MQIDPNTNATNIYGLEGPDHTRKWLKREDIKIYEGMNETYHEVINDCRFFVELDFAQHKTEPILADTFVKFLTTEFLNILIPFIDNEVILSLTKKNINNIIIFDETKYDFIEMDDDFFITRKIEYGADFYFAHCTETINQHIYIDAYFYDITFDQSGELKDKKVYVQFDNPQKQRIFWQTLVKAYLNKYKQFSQQLKEADVDFNTDFFDMAPYRKKSQLRTIYSPKYGETRYYRPAGATTHKKSYDRDIDEFMDISYNDSNFRASSFLINDSFYRDYIEINDDCENNFKPDNYIRTDYEEYCIDYLIKYSDINIDKFHIWKEAIYKISSFYFHLPLETRIKKVLDFCGVRGWAKEEHNRENITLLTLWDKSKQFHYFSLDKLAEFFTLKIFNNPINVPAITYEDIASNSVLLVKSGCGTCKTRNFFNKFSNKKILYISYRCTLTEDILSKYNAVSYLSADPNESAPDIFACQINSLYKFEHWLNNYEYIFFDECEELFNMFDFASQSKTTKPIQAILTIMMKIIFNKKKVVCASANLGLKTLITLDFFSANISETINNIYKDKAGYKFIEYNNEKLYEKKIIELVQAGKNLCIASNSFSQSGILVEKLKKIINADKILFIHGKETENKKNVMKDINKEIKKYQVFIYSPAIEAGVSIEVEHFDYIMGFFPVKNSANHQSAYQQLFRCRNPRNKEIFIFMGTCKKTKIEKLSEESIIREIKNKKKFAKAGTQNKEKSDKKQDGEKFTKKKDKISFNDSCFKNKENFELLCPYYKTIILGFYFGEYSRRYFRQLLRADLRSAGAMWVDCIEKPIPLTKDEKEEKKDILNDVQAQYIDNNDLGYYFNVNFGMPMDARIKKIISYDLFNNDFDKTVEIITNYYNYINKNKTYSDKVACMYKFLEFFETYKVKNENLDGYLIKFFEQKTETMNIAFNISRGDRKTKDEYINNAKYLKEKDKKYAELQEELKTAEEDRRKEIEEFLKKRDKYFIDQAITNRLISINHRLGAINFKLEKNKKSGYVDLFILNSRIIDNLNNYKRSLLTGTDNI